MHMTYFNVYLFFYFSVPISNSSNSSDSPLFFIEQLAVKHDFISFKLDVDSAITEIPIVLQILKNRKYAELIDEFFYEHHFKCEIMMFCAWGTAMPERVTDDIINDRVGALQIFRNLRKLGIRAHMWP